MLVMAEVKEVEKWTPYGQEEVEMWMRRVAWLSVWKSKWQKGTKIWSRMEADWLAQGGQEDDSVRFDDDRIQADELI